jgi:hypothetical protein
MPPLPKLGIVAGGGSLPARLASACRASGRDYFVLALEGQADAASLAGEPSAWIRLGEGGRGIELLHGEKVSDLVFAGPVRWHGFKSLSRPDWRTVQFFARLGTALVGDDSLLSAVVKELEKEGFRVVAPESLLDGFLAVPGPYGRIEPDEEARRDIDRGVAVVAVLGRLDIGQGVIVQQGIVLGVEAAEGTDRLIERCGALRRNGPGGVLVKARKPGQERRVDLPAIGPQTVRRAAESGLRGIAVQAGGALVFERDEVVRLADDAGLFVVGVTVSE